jgi:hypothetical protein
VEYAEQMSADPALAHVKFILPDAWVTLLALLKENLRGIFNFNIVAKWCSHVQAPEG